jgi:Fe-Mn family superoxide dismutase
MAFEHKVKALPFAYGSQKGISELTDKRHHDTHYAGYVAKRNEVEQKLETADKSKANANYSEFGELKRKETFNASGQILHELYWDMLGGDGKIESAAGSAMAKAIDEDFGSFENWKADMVATAKSSLGWAILCLDTSDGRLHNYLCDSHNIGAVWGAIPLLALDVFEHAYYGDYGPDRAKYIEACLSNVDWRKVEARYAKHALHRGKK